MTKARDLSLGGGASSSALATTNTAVALKAPIASPVLTGNVGIGSSSPVRQLEIKDDGTIGQAIVGIIADAGDPAGIFMGTTSNNNVGGIRYFTDTNKLALRANDEDRFLIDSRGNVGIGVTPENWYSTYSVLQIGGLGAIFAETSAGAGGATRLSNNVYLNASGSWAYQVTDEASHYQQVDGVHTFRVASSGSADAAISWNNAVTINNSGSLLINTTSTLGAGQGVLHLKGKTNNTAVSLQIASNGEKGLDFYNSSDSRVGYIAINASSVTFSTTSDYRLKENVTPMSGATAQTKLLKPCNFDWIAGGNVNGFIAHELAEVVPEAVTGTKDAMMDAEYEVTPAVLDDEGNETTAAVMGTRSVPDLQGIDQSKLVPLLTATIQELITRIEALEA